MIEVHKQSKQEEFAKAYDDFSDAIFRYCLFQTSNREKALDLTADTFTKTWEYVREGKEVENLRAFLYKVAGNLIIDDRRRKKAQSLDAMMETGFDEATDTDERSLHEENFDGKVALEALGQLDKKYRSVLTLRYAEDMNIKEIAKILRESENNISVRIHRGLEKLKKILNEKENEKE